MSSFLIVLDLVLLVIILVMVGIWAWNKIQAKSIGGELTNEEFKEGMRKAQIIDLREKEPFKRKHMMALATCHIPCLSINILSLEATCQFIFTQIQRPLL